MQHLSLLCSSLLSSPVQTLFYSFLNFLDSSLLLSGSLPLFLSLKSARHPLLRDIKKSAQDKVHASWIGAQEMKDRTIDKRNARLLVQPPTLLLSIFSLALFLQFLSFWLRGCDSLTTCEASGTLFFCSWCPSAHEICPSAFKGVSDLSKVPEWRLSRWLKCFLAALSALRLLLLHCLPQLRPLSCLQGRQRSIAMSRKLRFSLRRS